MKRFNLLILLLLPCCLLLSQSVSQSVIGAAGDVSQGKSITLDWTLGEMATSSIIYEKGMLTEGFHQPILKVENQEIIALPERLRSDVESISTLQWNVFPNPVSSQVSITIDAHEVGMALLELHDMEGSLLANQSIDLQQQNAYFDMSTFPSGAYYLLLKATTGELLQAAKIIKIH